MLMINEADTCRKYVLPLLLDAGWDRDPHSITEQRSLTDGRIVVMGTKAKRRKPKRADYLLRYAGDFPIAVVEAKAGYKSPEEGLQQAMEYAEMLGLKFAYATNGTGVIEHDYMTGVETRLQGFPSPDELWQRLVDGGGVNGAIAERLLTPGLRVLGKEMRYYQEIAVNRAVEAILEGKRRVLLTMATGTGKTLVAFEICWKLWFSRWNRDGAHRRPRILYLADRNFLVDDPKDRTFGPFGDAVIKIERGQAPKSREIYFSTYQSLAEDESRPGLYRQYARDFFDLVIVDECHRGSARDESNWREILRYFSPAFQLGMTATPLREESRDTYRYFDNPLYTYSLRQGIDDGFLAPYRVHRVITTADAAGWRPSKGDLDRYGREIPDDEYGTKDFEKVVALRARTEAIAAHLTDHLRRTDRMAKTIVFCVDQEHASEMRAALVNLNADLVAKYPDYVCRVTANEGEIGRGHMSRFQELESASPVILTTSQLLTTGLDAPTCKNIVLARVIGSLPEFKQIIGRGTRVRADYGKLSFDILDYTGSATRMFADPDFDGEPVAVISITIDDDGNQVDETFEFVEEPVAGFREAGEDYDPFTGLIDDADGEPRKYYVDGGYVRVVAHLVYELDPDGKQLRMVELSDYAGERVRTLYANGAALQAAWASPAERAELIDKLEAAGVDLEGLAASAGRPDADPLDLLCHVAFNAPLRTRRERAERVRRDRMDFFDSYGPAARAVLVELLEKYAEHGTAQFTLPEALKVPPISERGNVMEIAAQFGGAERLREAVSELQSLLYAA